MSFTAPVDIGNRALQHCGAKRIDVTQGFAEDSKNASEVGFCYDKLRQAELQRTVWYFAIKRAVLRAIDTTTMFLAASLWSSTTTYFVGSIVADETGYLWISQYPTNLNNQPQNSNTWQPYFGPLTVSLFVATTAYYAGELVYTAAGDGTNRVYLSLQGNNSDVPATATAYDATVTYRANQVVTYLTVPYMSLVDLNTGNTPLTSPTQWTATFVGGAGSIKWLQIGGAEFPSGVTLATLNIIYPIGAGPSTDSTSRNVFRLPAGYLRKAAQDPHAGSTSALGAPTGRLYDDWDIEDVYIVSGETGPIVFRFAADVVDVTKMHPMFCEGLALRIALAVCETVTQSNSKLTTIASEYKTFMGDARTIDGIEKGPEEAAIDDYLSCRG